MMKLVCANCGIDIDPMTFMIYYEKRLQTMLLGLAVFILLIAAVVIYLQHADAILLLKGIQGIKR